MRIDRPRPINIHLKSRIRCIARGCWGHAPAQPTTTVAAHCKGAWVNNGSELPWLPRHFHAHAYHSGLRGVDNTPDRKHASTRPAANATPSPCERAREKESRDKFHDKPRLINNSAKAAARNHFSGAAATLPCLRLSGPGRKALTACCPKGRSDRMLMTMHIWVEI